MKTNQFLICCVVLGAALTACKGKTAAPAESEPQAAAPAVGEAQAVAPPTLPAKFVRDAKSTPVDVDTSAPANVGAVPEDAERSESGLAWVVLQKGTGEAHPAAGDTVRMNFIGWTADGKLLDESLTGGRPAAIPIAALFRGWAEGVQLMVEGEKRRFWIPGKLAFGEAKPGEPAAEGQAPRGMLVYDIELLGFEPRPGD